MTPLKIVLSNTIQQDELSYSICILLEILCAAESSRKKNFTGFTSKAYLCLRPTVRESKEDPVYNDNRYSSKNRYNINSVCTQISGLCIFFIDSPMLFFRKTNV